MDTYVRVADEKQEDVFMVFIIKAGAGVLAFAGHGREHAIFDSTASILSGGVSRIWPS